MTVQDFFHNLPEGRETSAGLYVHVPFCLSKCHYCSFYSIPANRKSIARYYTSLCGQIDMASQIEPWNKLHYSTVFLGGGTPSILPVGMLCDLLLYLKRNFNIDKEAEISVEVNPATINTSELSALGNAGFNRLSIGCQSLSDRYLSALGRPHDRRAVLDAYESARQAGFDNISLDFMYGLPGQSVQQWTETLKETLALAPEHLSLYELTIEPDTPFYRAAAENKLEMPSEDKVLEMMDVTQNIMAAHFFSHYEISNYARHGRQCRHNINYWENGSYLGLGPAAVSSYRGSRWKGIQNVALYCQNSEQHLEPWQLEDQLDLETYFRETVMIGLRMTAGIDCALLKKRFGIEPVQYYGQTLRKLLDLGLLEINGSRLFLSNKGLPLANQVMAVLV